VDPGEGLLILPHRTASGNPSGISGISGLSGLSGISGVSEVSGAMPL
jgi:hypothetical protein